MTWKMRLTFDADRDVSMTLLGHLPMVALELGGLRVASSIAILEVHPAGGREVSWSYTPMTSAEAPEAGSGTITQARERVGQLAQRIMEVPGARMQRYRLGGSDTVPLNGNGRMISNGVPNGFTDEAYDRGIGYGDLTATNASFLSEDEQWAFNGDRGRSPTVSNSRIGRSRSPSPVCVGGNATRSRSKSPRRTLF